MDNAVDDLTETLGQASLGDGGQDPEQLLFKPPSGSEVSKSLDEIPAYLFRVVSPQSAGETNGIWARSESARQRTVSSTKDIFSFKRVSDQQTKAFELNVHLQWYNSDYPAVEDNFVSWTSSLLFAIQYIYYRLHHDIPRPCINDIKLYIIETALFQRGTFIRDLDLIKHFREFDREKGPRYWNLKSLHSLRTRRSFYFGEYLSQGSLKIENNFRVIPASILFDHNRLCRLQPAFINLFVPPPQNATKLANAVIDLRKDIWSSNLPALSSVKMSDRLAVTKEILDNISIHDLDHRWRFALGIYFAALIGPIPATGSHIGNESSFFEYFQSTFWAGQKPFDFNFVAPNTMPELKHARKLLFETRNYFQLKEALIPASATKPDLWQRAFDELEPEKQQLI
ncbi:uncharacterized protein N7459_004866 [Penicillium hispanicum]|uniref:uncharacterized protein n=1 Tax=Penicillium hispanicum TaxID=1080232 RepID=UPI0025411AAA|nr:uncharacterized protein N7459_004866 [Penicillium hispanicum]KAJ5585066.1 hypothetical protein N7459_004866 [Penicillium hispanicum]